MWDYSSSEMLYQGQQEILHILTTMVKQIIHAFVS